MKHPDSFRNTKPGVVRARAIVFGLALLCCPLPGWACAGSRGAVCALNPTACLKSMVLTKSIPAVFVVPTSGSAVLNLPMTLFITCPATNNCGNGCPAPAVPVAASLTVTLTPCPPLPPGPPAPPLSGTIITGATMPMPGCSSAGTFNSYTVPVTIPALHPPGVYCVTAVATVRFSDGMTLTAQGDTTVCLIESAPGRPGVPRLNLELLTPLFPRLAPGDQTVVRYRVTNNDPNNSVRLTAFATSKQGAVRPQGGSEQQGVFAISSPFGDDFPIAFDPSTACLPLPPHPYTQQTLFKTLPDLAPGQTTDVLVGIRSYGQCDNGSCSESALRLEGFFVNSSPIVACAGMTFLVDVGVPSAACGSQVNDCNQNGIPDALDISSRRSDDRNFNALPDECEAVINIPTSVSVSPGNPLPGAPIMVRVAFNETFPITNVWANGHRLNRLGSFSLPFWSNSIPADISPGPATVYFTAVDTQGGLTTMIGVYTVLPAPQSSQLAIRHSTNRFVAVTWSPPQATLQCTPIAPGSFADVPSATSPYMVDTRLAPARVYRLRLPAGPSTVSIRLDGTARPGGVALDWSPRDWRLEESPNLLTWQNTPSTPPAGEYYRPAPLEAPPAPGSLVAGMRGFRTTQGTGASMALGSVYSVNLVGYINFALRVGQSNFFAFSLLGLDRKLNTLVPLDFEAHGTTLHFFDLATQRFGPAHTFVGGGVGWRDPAGASPVVDANQSACVIIPRTSRPGGTTVFVTIVGEAPQGTFQRLLPPGYSLNGPLVPLRGGITSTHQLQPNDGDLVFLPRAGGQSFYTYEYFEGLWILLDDSSVTEPIIGPGDAFFYLNNSGPLNWSRSFMVN